MNVSVIVAVKNETILLQRCIESLLAQSQKPEEIIIADDGSSAETKTILSRYENQSGIKVIYLEKSMGQSAARNLAIAASSGDLIAICDADDYSFPQRIEWQKKQFSIHHELFLCGGGFTVTDGYYPWKLYLKSEEIKYQFLINNPIVHSSAMFRRNGIENPYNSEFDTSEDYEFFERMRMKAMINLPRKLVHYHIRKRSSEAVQLQTGLAGKIRERAMLRDFPASSEEDIRRQQLFAECRPGLLPVEVENHIQQLTETNVTGAEILSKILYTQFFLYCMKNDLKPDWKMRNRILKFMDSALKTKMRHFVKWL